MNAQPPHSLAILPVSGVILPYENALSQLLGATTLDTFAKDFQEALANPHISEIILKMDSPGGVVTGVHECAEMLYQARGKKPMTAYISGMGASAAYWLASAADEIVLDATASVGSIGVLSIHRDDKAKKAQQGLSEIQIVSTQSPKKRLDIATEEGKLEAQLQVDAIADVFVATVARNRKVSVETVLSDFGQGSLCVGIQAVKQGLADRVTTFAQLLQEKSGTTSIKPLIREFSDSKLSSLSSHHFPLPTGATMTDITSTETENATDTLQCFVEKYPGITATLRGEGAQQERQRIQSVEAQSISGHEDLIKTLKFDGKTTAAEAAIQVLAAEKNRQSTFAQPPHLAALPIHQSLAEEMHSDSSQKTLTLEEQWKEAFEKDRALQAEFGIGKRISRSKKQNTQIDRVNLGIVHLTKLEIIDGIN